MKRNPKIGLLPLYLKLYDDKLPEYRAGFDPSIDCYLRDGGYEQLRKAVTMERQSIINEVKASGLRGRGGAGRPPRAGSAPS